MSEKIAIPACGSLVCSGDRKTCALNQVLNNMQKAGFERNKLRETAGDYSSDCAIVKRRAESLGRVEYSPGHSLADVDQEIKNRLSSLVIRAVIWKKDGINHTLIDELKNKGVDALKTRFSDKTDFINQEIEKLKDFI